MKAFNFNDFVEYDLVLYFRHAVLGGRRYLLGEKDERIPIAKKKYQMMKLLDGFVKTIFYGLIIFMVFIRYDTFGITRKFCKFFEHFYCKN